MDEICVSVYENFWTGIPSTTRWAFLCEVFLVAVYPVSSFFFQIIAMIIFFINITYFHIDHIFFCKNATYDIDLLRHFHRITQLY